jgi:2C-methyl-D-erythritol 2,4-cyclodiphosphate synthase
VRELRIGLGVDAHALEEGVPLVLGGVAFAAITFVLYRWVTRLGRQ